jgi:hypothetical protein
MYCKAKAIIVVICAFFAVTLLSVQTDNSSFFTADSDHSVHEQLIKTLASQVADADLYFKEAYERINLDVPLYPTYNPQLIQNAETRYTRYRYLLGVIRPVPSSSMTPRRISSG